MSRITLAAIALAASMPAPVVAEADQPASCFRRIELVKHLASTFKESPVAVGLTDAGMLLEVFTSPSGETWTLAVTMPNGMTCLMATGQDWQAVPRTAELGPPA